MEFLNNLVQINGLTKQSLIFGAIAIFLIISLYFIAIGNIFRKAGYWRRAILVPVYPIYLIFLISHKTTKRFRIAIISYFIALMLYLAHQRSSELSFLEPFRAIWTLIPLIISLSLPFSLALRFGKHRTYWLWLLLFWPIFILHLAFDKSSYKW